MNFVDNLDVQNIVYFLPANLMSVSSLAIQSQAHLCFLPTELNASLKWVTKYQLVDMVGVRGTWFPYSTHRCLLLGHPLVLSC